MRTASSPWRCMPVRRSGQGRPHASCPCCRRASLPALTACWSLRGVQSGPSPPLQCASAGPPPCSACTPTAAARRHTHQQSAPQVHTSAGKRTQQLLLCKLHVCVVEHPKQTLPCARVTLHTRLRQVCPACVSVSHLFLLISASLSMSLAICAGSGSSSTCFLHTQNMQPATAAAQAALSSCRWRARRVNARTHWTQLRCCP